MALRHIIGVDHVVVGVRALDEAAAAWRALGFTISPRGTHSAHMGSGNYTIVFGDDYLELLGILVPTDHNRPLAAFLEKREGIERTAFTTDDAAGGVAELRARGIKGEGPLSFSRPVDLPDGTKGEAAFNIFGWPRDEAPAGMRIFACQHLTRPTVWIPELQKHANGAQGLVRIEVLAAQPDQAAEHMARLIDQPAERAGDAWRVRSGGTRAGFEFFDAAGLAQRYPDAARAGAADTGGVALVIATDDLAKAQAIPGAISHDDGVSIPASAATGVIVRFVAC